MRDISDLTRPLNLLQEKQTFLADSSYNPHFVYESEIDSQRLQAYGQPNDHYYEHALKMLEVWATQPKSAVSEYVTVEEVKQAVADFNQRYHLLNPVTVDFSESLVTRCLMLERHLTFQLPIAYTRDQFLGLCHHELETHILRYLNHQTLNLGEDLCPEAEVCLTEEGLATLNTYLFRDDQLFRKAYLTYVAVYWAQRESFASVFQKLKGLGLSDNTALNITVRVKRGLKDTAQPGGLTKDTTYFEGALEVYRWLQNPDHDPKWLYAGMNCLDNAQACAAKGADLELLYPSFFDDLDVYRQKIQTLGSVNGLDTL